MKNLSQLPMCVLAVIIALAMTTHARAVVISEDFEAVAPSSATPPAGWSLVTAGTSTASYTSTASGQGSNGTGGSTGLAGQVTVSNTGFPTTDLPGGYLVNGTSLSTAQNITGTFDFMLVPESTFDDVVFVLGDIADGIQNASTGELLAVKLAETTSGGIGSTLNDGLGDASRLDTTGATYTQNTWFNASFTWTPTSGTTGNFTITTNNFSSNVTTLSTTGFTFDTALAQIGFGSVNDIIRFDNVNVTTSIPSFASPTHYEPFATGGGDYTADTNIQTQGPTVLGFSGTWSGTSTIFQPKNEDMGYSDGTYELITSGGSLGQTVAAAADREVHRTIDAISGTNPIYISMLMKIDVTDLGNIASNDNMYAQLLQTTDNRNGLKFGIINGDLAIAGRSTGGMLDDKFVVESGYTDELTYLWVIKIVPDDGGFNDRVIVYLNPTDLTYEAGNAIDLEQLTAAFVTGFSLDQFLVRTSGIASGSFMFDELRIGNAWAQVVPYAETEAAPIPTPAALPMGLALVGLGALRRWRFSRN